MVSHSRALAHAAVELAQQMGSAGEQVPVAVAAGMDDGSLGTEAETVARALADVASTQGDGVLVLVDLGSAVMSAEMACELVDPELSSRVRLSSAPLVEGLVAAVVTAGAGADLATVAHEAERSLIAKQDQISPGDQSSPGGQESGAQTTVDSDLPEHSPDLPEHTRELVVPNRTGLHARPAAEFVQIVARFSAHLSVWNRTKHRGPVDGGSLSAVATLGARQADVLRLRADGPDAPQLLAALQEFADRGFGDHDGLAPVAPGAQSVGPWADARLTSAAGPVSGPAFWLPIEVPTAPRDSTAAEELASPEQPPPLDQAVARARADLAEIRQRASDQGNADAADMIAAHMVLLEDQGLLAPVRQAIADGRDPVTAWTEQIRTLRTTFESMDDEYLSARGQDVSSVGRRVRAYLSGGSLPDVSQARGVVIVDELDAPTAVLLDRDKVVAVVTRSGGRTGHGVMVASARGIPVLVNAARDFDHVPDGADITIDVDPTPQAS